MTESDASAFDLLAYLTPFGIDEAHCREPMAAGRTLPDTVWALASEVLRLNRADSLLIRQMSFFLEREGRSAAHLQAPMARALATDLEVFASRGVKRVEFRCDDNCPTCEKFEGKSIALDVARREQPLPRSGCTDPNGCRCWYVDLP